MDWHSTEQARSRLADSARAIHAPGYKVRNPITQAKRSFKMRQSEDPRDRFIVEMQEKLASLEKVVLGSSEARDAPSAIEKAVIADELEQEGRSLRNSGLSYEKIQIALRKKAMAAQYSHKIQRINVDTTGALLVKFDDNPAAIWRGTVDEPTPDQQPRNASPQEPTIDGGNQKSGGAQRSPRTE